MPRNTKPTYKDALAEIAALEKSLREVVAEKAEWKECARKLVLLSFVRIDAASDGDLAEVDLSAALKSATADTKSLADIGDLSPSGLTTVFKSLWEAADFKESDFTDEEQVQLAEMLS